MKTDLIPKPDLTPLYWGTAVVLLFAIVLVLIVVTFNNHNRRQDVRERAQRERDHYWNNRMTQIENLVLNEIKGIGEIIKNLK